MPRLFTPPEWPHWSTADRFAYCVSFLCLTVLCAAGAGAILAYLVRAVP